MSCAALTERALVPVRIHLAYLRYLDLSDTADDAMMAGLLGTEQMGLHASSGGVNARAQNSTFTVLKTYPRSFTLSFLLSSFLAPGAATPEDVSVLPHLEALLLRGCPATDGTLHRLVAAGVAPHLSELDLSKVSHSPLQRQAAFQPIYQMCTPRIAVRDVSVLW